MLSAALAFTTFSKLGPQRRAWFFWLAAKAGRQILEKFKQVVPGTGVLVGALFDVPATADAPERVDVPGVDRMLGRIWRLPRDSADADVLFKEAYREAVTACDVATIVPVLHDMFADASRRLGPDARTTLALLHSIGYWTLRAGQPRAARRLFDEAWRRRSEALGPTDPDTLESKRAAGDPGLFRGDG
jgi:hypothetical protein